MDPIIYFLQTILFAEKRGIRSNLSISLVKRRDREKDGGLLIKDKKGSVLLGVKARSLSLKAPNLVICAQQLVLGKITMVAKKIDDDVVAVRLIEYLQQYYGKYTTNCSTLVEYLRTGVFVECDINRHSMMFSAGMNLYTGQKIEPGDSFCVLYFKKDAMRRRASLATRSLCKRNKKYAMEDLLMVKPIKKGKNWSSEEILALYHSGSSISVFKDYHFMYCVGIDNGSPILVYQTGLHKPWEKEKTPSVVVSVGMINIFPSIPACMFIKKGGR